MAPFPAPPSERHPLSLHPLLQDHDEAAVTLDVVRECHIPFGRYQDRFPHRMRFDRHWPVVPFPLRNVCELLSNKWPILAWKKETAEVSLVSLVT